MPETKQNQSVWYEQRRNELLELLKKANDLPIPQQYKTELAEAIRKCQENAFEITLLGEFQGGKSTTFNALCDGRDISPRGLGGGGIKTSAAVISAQNIADDETRPLEDGTILKEWAEITYRTADDIVLSISTVLRPIIQNNKELASQLKSLNPNLSVEEFKNKLNTDIAFSQLVNLDDEKQRYVLCAAANLMWQQWQQDITQRRSMSPDALDLLRIATLQLRYYGTEAYQALVSKQIMPINQFQELVAFPKKWLTRWAQGKEADFSLDECAFIFINSILVRLHSENLQRLGCRITDCPGLFANAFDTGRAEKAVFHSDAIWYLINGEKTIGQKDLSIIRWVADKGLHEKIGATANLKGGSHEQKMEEVLPVTVSELENAGFPINVLPYNARLAFLAMQGKLMLKNPDLFSDMDYSNMLIDARVRDDSKPDPKGLWASMVSSLGNNIEVDEVMNCQELNEDSVKIVRQHSYIDGILSNLENCIIPKKSKSILIDNGSARASKALQHYEGDLKSAEDSALADVEKWQKQVEESRNQLNSFICKSKQIIKDSCLGEGKIDNLAKQLADNIVDLTIDQQFIDTLSVDIATILTDIEAKLFLSQECLKTEIDARLSPKVYDDYSSAMWRGIYTWLHGIDYKSVAYLKTQLEELCQRIRNEWNDPQFKKNTLLDGLCPPEVSTADISNMEDSFTEKILEDKSKISEIAETMRPGIWSSIWTIITLGLFKKTGEAREKAIQKLAVDVKPEVKGIVENREFLREQARPLANNLKKGMLATIKKRMDTQLDSLREKFEKRVKENNTNLNKSTEERRRIASENRKLRKEVIEPLRTQIQTFQDEVSKELA